jgi:hypothetical protein
VDGVDVSTLFFNREMDKTAVVGNASSPRHEIALSSAALIVGEWKLILPNVAIPDVSAGACTPPLPPGTPQPAGKAFEPWDVLPANVNKKLGLSAAEPALPNVSSMCAASQVYNNTGCTTAGHYNGDGTPMDTWAECCAACAAQAQAQAKHDGQSSASSCKAWTYHPKDSEINPGMCILANVSRLESGVALATCGCVGGCEGPPPPEPGQDPACGFWTGPVWPTQLGHKDPLFEADLGCPVHGCLFHLPSDPQERTDLSLLNPDTLKELTARLDEIRKGEYQTMNYTAGCDECLTVDAVAAKYNGFVAPPCSCGNASYANTLAAPHAARAHLKGDDRFAWIADIETHGGTHKLEARTYYIDRQYILPNGTAIIGAGSGGSSHAR